eukprot:776283-Rhodomonas_salina.1
MEEQSVTVGGTPAKPKPLPVSVCGASACVESSFELVDAGPGEHEALTQRQTAGTPHGWFGLCFAAACGVEKGLDEGTCRRGLVVLASTS